MISITLLEGPFAGRTRSMTPNQDPFKAFGAFIKLGWRWKTDYAQATDAEIYTWFRADLMAKATFAFRHSIPVYFLDKKYFLKGGDKQKRKEKLQELENDIVSSGRVITIDQDDDRKLVIRAVGYEH
jgi:hypothetical protein